MQCGIMYRLLSLQSSSSSDGLMHRDDEQGCCCLYLYFAISIELILHWGMYEEDYMIWRRELLVYYRPSSHLLRPLMPGVYGPTY